MAIGVSFSASSSYARDTSGEMVATRRARCSPSSVPSAANFSSQTSSVVAMSAVKRPFDCFNSAFRCLSTRSNSVRSASMVGVMATSASSRNWRRTPGESLTRSRSSGENTVVRITPNKSFVRASFWRFTCTLLRPTLASSASISTSRPSS